MKTIVYLLATAGLVIACGDNKDRPDAQTRRDSSGPDAMCSNCPAAPMLGAQLDRMGRPAINTALNMQFSTDATARGTAKDAYNTNDTYASWQTTFGPAFAQSLAIYDVLDGGFCGNGLCETGETGTDVLGTACGDCTGAADVGSGIGCGNQVMYGGPTATATSYSELAGLLSNDILYLDTMRGQCSFYFAVEFGVVTGAGNTTCGGRAPAYDVIDFTYTALALGVAGFSTDGQFTPGFGDMVPPHTDYLSTFPYLGEPH